LRYGHGVSLQFFAVPGGRINNAVGLRIVSSDFENAEALRLSGVLGVAGAKRLGQSGVIEGLGLNRAEVYRSTLHSKAILFSFPRIVFK